MKTNITNSKRVLTAVKFTPVVSAFAMMITTANLLLGAESSDVEIIRALFSFSTFGTILLFVASYFLHLCTLHRLFIVYTEVISDCLAFQHGVGFGAYLQPARITALLLGLALIAYLILKFDNFCKNG